MPPTLTELREEPVLLSVEGPIAYVRLNRGAKRNALDKIAISHLFNKLKMGLDLPEVKAIVLHGADRTFSAGHDLGHLTDSAESAMRDFDDVYRLIERGPKPVIAAIEGVAAAGGAGLALATDIRIMGASARIGWPQVKRGIGSVSGPTMLARVVPYNIAAELLLTGEFITAAKALELGLVNSVVDDDEVLMAAKRVALAIEANAPLAVQAMKEAAWATRELGQERARAVGKSILDRILKTEDAAEGLKAFSERRAPVWKGC